MHNYATAKDVNQSSKSNKKSVSVVGASGYSGLELTKLLLNHPAVQLTHCFTTRQFKLTDDVLDSRAKNISCMLESDLLNNLSDIVFLATPAEASLKLAPEIIKKGKTVIDLSGAFRLKKSDYKTWYGFEHSEPQLLKDADYGLVPFAGPTKKKLIANPGCYATAIGLALIPLIKRNLIDLSTLVIDAKSGTTGAGRKASENLLFSEVEGGILPYKVGKHQHIPELVEAIETNCNVTFKPVMATHLLPARRGILVSMYAKTAAKIEDIQNAFNEQYSNYSFVRHGTEIAKLARLQNVVGTYFAHFSYEIINSQLYLFSTIDNLLKGAASQAIENLNRVLDLPPTMGL